MDLSSLLDRFDLLTNTPNGVSKLRSFILQLAVQGDLTDRAPDDIPAETLLEKIRDAKRQHLANNDSPRRKELGPLPDTFPFSLPDTWVWTRLDEVCPYIQRGKRPDYSQIEKIPVVSQKCVQWDGFKPSRVRFIDPESLEKYQSYRFLKEGDLLWNSTGVGTVGRINVYNGELDEYEKVVADSHVTVVRPLKDLVLPRYIYTWIASSHVQRQIDSDMTSGSTKQTELNTSTVRKTLLPLPPLEEQKRVVATVENLMDECDDLEARQDRARDKRSAFATAATHALRTADSETEVQTAWTRIREHFDPITSDHRNLNDLRKSILDLAVRGRLTKRGHGETSADILLEKIKTAKQQYLENNDSPRRKELDPLPDTFPFGLPRTWVWTRLDEVCVYIQRGKRPDYSRVEQVPVVSQKCVQWDGFKPDRVRFIKPDSLDKYQSYRFLEEGDLLWNSTGVGTVGRINVYRGELNEYEHVVADSHVTVVRPVKDLVLPRYIYFWIASSHIQERIDSDMTSGSTKQTELNTSTVRKTLLPLPPLEEQSRIVERLGDLSSTFDQLRARLTEAAETKSDLLDAVFTGAMPDKERTKTQAAE